LNDLRFAVCCAALQALDETDAACDTATERLAALGERYDRLMREATGMHSRTEGMLAQNLDSLVESAGKLTAAQVGGLAEVACC
jgi:ABC-type transporter Mla subunit MlaD